MHSLRNRLLVGIIGGMTILLIVFSLVIYTVTARTLVKQVDVSLAATARMLAASVEIDDGEVELELDVQKIPEFQSSEYPCYYQLWWADGTVVAKSASLGTDNLLRFEGPVGTEVFRALELRNGQPGRVVALRFRPRIEGHNSSQQPAEQEVLSLAVAQDTSDLQCHLQFLRWLLLIASAGTITLSLLVATFVVRQGLRPVRSLAAEIAAIREDNLTVRVGIESIPEEIILVAKRLNDLLSRLEASFNRERRFTADVAHELRTPLAGIRSALEVALMRVRDLNEYQATLSDCLAISKNMQKMVDNLLTLARIDAGKMTFRYDRIYLSELVDSCWKPLSNRAVDRGVIFENHVPAEISCESDSENLTVVLTNLLDNSVQYTNEGGQIWTTARKTDDSVEITVANTGCQLTNEQALQVFDRFWRADPSRSQTVVHCGLGLSLVQKIISALGGRTVAELKNGGIFTVRLILPTKKVFL